MVGGALCFNYNASPREVFRDVIDVAEVLRDVIDVVKAFAT